MPKVATGRTDPGCAAQACRAPTSAVITSGDPVAAPSSLPARFNNNVARSAAGLPPSRRRPTRAHAPPPGHRPGVAFAESVPHRRPGARLQSPSPAAHPATVDVKPRYRCVHAASLTPIGRPSTVAGGFLVWRHIFPQPAEATRYNLALVIFQVSCPDCFAVLSQYLLPKQARPRSPANCRAEAGALTTRAPSAVCRALGVNMAGRGEPDTPAASLQRILHPVAEGRRGLADAAFICPVDGGSASSATSTATGSSRPGASHYDDGAGRRRQRTGARFDNGSFATLYLSARDYHRHHMPCADRLTRMIHVPGALFSVEPDRRAACPACLPATSARGLRFRIGLRALRAGAGRRHHHRRSMATACASAWSICRAPAWYANGAATTTHRCRSRAAKKWEPLPARLDGRRCCSRKAAAELPLPCQYLGERCMGEAMSASNFRHPAHPANARWRPKSLDRRRCRTCPAHCSRRTQPAPQCVMRFCLWNSQIGRRMSTRGKQETIDRQPPDTADARPDDLPRTACRPGSASSYRCSRSCYGTSVPGPSSRTTPRANALLMAISPRRPNPAGQP